jgi:cytochrome c biogenesis protein CcmG/thiol:disulfide interchange protein DsbE
MARKFLFLLCALLHCAPAWAAEKLPLLQIGGESYTNVTITSVSPTEVYFIHARGLGNAKLRNLSPELQKRFGFEPAQAEQAERQQTEANQRYTALLLENKPGAPERRPATLPPASQEPPKALLGQPVPTLVVQKWLAEPPDMIGKFVVVCAWATWCVPCRQAIPQLNELSSRFKDRLVVVGISDEPEDLVRLMTSPKIDFTIGLDTEQRFVSAVGVHDIPFVVVVDPKGIVRYQGHPASLNARTAQAILDQYKP